ncbi:MAG: zinc ribbon domain-containing protein [Thermoplasmata archaeon]
MRHKHHIAKSINDVSFHAFKQKLKWKAEKYGKNIIEINRLYHLSKICSRCRNINHSRKVRSHITH